MTAFRRTLFLTNVKKSSSRQFGDVYELIVYGNDYDTIKLYILSKSDIP